MVYTYYVCGRFCICSLHLQPFLASCLYEVSISTFEKGNTIIFAGGNKAMLVDGMLIFGFAQQRVISELAVKTADGRELVVMLKDENGKLLMPELVCTLYCLHAFSILIILNSTNVGL